MLTNTLIFDIETGGLPEDQIEIPEFEPPSNYKTLDAINKYLEKKKQDYIEKAAISVFTGEVLAIGYQYFDKNGVTDGVKIIHGFSEQTIIEEFWKVVNATNHCIPSTNKYVGWNSNGFDIPFLLRKSWKYGIVPPTNPKFLSDYGRPNNNFVDLMLLWGCGVKEYVKLDTVAKFFGVGAKNGDGKFFKEMYQEDKEKALKYLENDIDMTVKVAQCMLDFD